jgi:hypothetical protein
MKLIISVSFIFSDCVITLPDQYVFEEFALQSLTVITAVSVDGYKHPHRLFRQK